MICLTEKYFLIECAYFFCFIIFAFSRTSIKLGIPFQPGTADDPEELRELNVANNLTITYNNGNGTVAGPVREYKSETR